MHKKITKHSSQYILIGYSIGVVMLYGMHILIVHYKVKKFFVYNIVVNLPTTIDNNSISINRNILCTWSEVWQ